MKRRTNLIFAFVFAFIIFSSFAGATLTVSSVPDLNQTSGSFTLNVSSSSNETVNISIAEIIQGSQNIAFSPSSSSFELNDSLNNRTKEVTISYTIGSGFSFDLGKTYSTTMTIEGTNSTTISKKLIFKETDYCNGVDNQGNLEIRDMNFDVIKGFGDSNSYWYLMDNVDVEVEVDNKGSWDVQNVKVEWEIDTTNGEKIMDGDVSDFDLSYRENNKVTISFKLDQDFRRFEGEDAVFYVRATGRIDDRNSQYDNKDTCSYSSKKIDVRTRDDFMIVDDLKINGEKVGRNDILKTPIICDSSVDVSGLVYNIGRDKQKSSYVEIYNKDLKIGKRIDLSDINGFNSENLDLQFKIPKDAKEKTYPLEFRVYDKNGDIFQNQEKDDSKTIVYFKVEGNCKIADPTIDVELSSPEAKAGNEMIVKVYLRNNDVKNATFTISADGFSSWATLKQVNPETFILGSGTSKDVYLTFNLKDSSVGEQKFNLIVTGNGDLLTNKPVLITVQEGSFWKSNFGNLDWRIVGIIILNLILIVAIVIVARRVLKK